MASSCLEGECIPILITKLENLSQLFQKECFPKGQVPTNLNEYYETHGLSEQCWQYITEINQLDNELQKHQSQLEGRLDCSQGQCQTLANVPSSINNIEEINQELSCTPDKKKQIANECPGDLTCVFATSVLSLTTLGVGGFVAENYLPKEYKPQNCNLANDSCVTQLATSFLKAAATYFSAVWDVLKMAGRAVNKKMTEFWNWVSGAENHSSTSQLALAQASSDPDVFQALLDDFPGTMGKIWQTFVASMKEWLKSSIFCQKWEGTPHFGKCLQPTNSYDCLPCKTFVTGLCGISGTIVAEIVPAFLTGGLVSAVKHGVSGAAKISRLFKVSAKGMLAIKKSSLVPKATLLTKSIALMKTAVSTSLKAIRAYALSPLRAMVKNSYQALAQLTKRGTVYVAQTAAGKTIIFSGRALKTSLKVVLLPVDNPMVTMSFKAGMRTVDKAFKLGAPKLGVKTAATAAIIESNAKLEPLLAQIELTKMPAKVNGKRLLTLERELLTAVTPKRQSLIRAAFKKENVKLGDIVSNIYPELQYGSLARTLPKSKIIQAEKELLKEITRLPSGSVKQTLLKDYKIMVATGAKREIVLNSTQLVPKKPLEIPNVPAGAVKVVSPTLRGTQVNKEKDKEKK